LITKKSWLTTVVSVKLAKTQHQATTFTVITQTGINMPEDTTLTKSQLPT